MIKKNKNLNISLLTWIKRKGDQLQFLQIQDLHLVTLNLLFASISGFILGATFVGVGAGRIFLKLFGNEFWSDFFAFVSGFGLMFLAQWTIGTMVQIAQLLKEKDGGKQAKRFVYLISTIVITIAFTGAYHLYDYIENKAIMVFVTLFLVLGELCILCLSTLRVSIKTSIETVNWVEKQIAIEEENLYLQTTISATESKQVAFENTVVATTNTTVAKKRDATIFQLDKTA